jgi:predicted nucleic acid-binding protein
VLDTSVVAATLLASAGSHRECQDLLETELCQVAFRLALVERWGRKAWKQARWDGRARRRAGRLLDDALVSWHRLRDAFDWRRVALDHVADAVPSLVAAHGLDSYDAVHVATARLLGIDDVLTLDRGFAAVPDLQIHTTRTRLASFRRLRA